MSKLCPHCGVEMKEGAKFCSRCGYEYNHGKICPNCHATIKDDAQFCTNCGYKFNTSTKFQINPLEIIICIALIISSFIIPTIAIPILITLICIILLKKKGKWYKINKALRRISFTIATLVVIIIMTNLFGYSSRIYESSTNDPSDSKNSITTETFKEEFCKNIEIDYSSDEWINENGIEMYFNGTGLSIGLIEENNKLSGISIVQDMYKTGQDYAINGSLNLLDEAFQWKCAALSVLTGSDSQEISEQLRNYNLENQKIENSEFADGIFIETTTENNLSIFTITIK